MNKQHIKSQATISADNYVMRETFAPVLMSGTICMAADHTWVVDTGLEKYSAGKAPSCLLRPQMNDTVLCTQLQANEVLIIAILAQANPLQQHYDFAQQVGFTINEGALCVRSEHLELNSLYSTQVHSPLLKVSAQESTVTLEHLQYHGEQISLQVKQAQHHYQFLQKNAETYHINAHDMVESVADLKHQILGDLHTLVNQTYRLDCDTAAIYAEDDFKIQAEQIQMN